MSESNVALTEADFCSALLRATRGGVVDACGAVSIADIQRWATQLTSVLHDTGLAPDEPVLVPITSRAEDVAAILGVISAGGVAVPVHARAHAHTVASVRRLTQARYEIKMADRDCAAQPSLISVAEAAPAPRALLRGAALITFTSGSTGQPKGVVLSRSRMSAKLCSIQDTLNMPEGSVTGVPLQLTFSFGQWATFLTLLRGGTVLMPERFDALATARDLSARRCDYLAAVPTMLRMLPEGEASESPFTILTGGEAVSAELRQRIFSRWHNATILSIYGLTETGTCDVYHRDSAGQAASEALGFPAPGVTVRADPQTRELLVNTPFAMLGYLDMADETRSTLNDGWLRTGDLAQVSPNGEVRFLGRLKELINRAGNKVSPLEVEGVYVRHPAVRAALATGVADARTGEAIHLLLVLRAGMTVQPEALREWGRERMESFKAPDRIYFADALPLGSTGKADRAALRARIERGELS